MLRRYGKILLAAVAAVVGGWQLRPDFFDRASSELVALFALLMAGVLPTAALTATILRAGAMPVRKILLYRDALLRQLAVWGGLFVVAFAGCFFVIVAKAVNWKLAISIPISFSPLKTFSLELIPLFNGAITAALVLLGSRILDIFKGLRSLVLLSSELALGEAKERDFQRSAATARAIERAPERKGHGEEVDISL